MWVIGTWRAAVGQGTFSSKPGPRPPGALWTVSDFAKMVCTTPPTIRELLATATSDVIPKAKYCGRVSHFSEVDVKVLNLLIACNPTASPERVAARFTELTGVPVSDRHVKRLVVEQHARVRRHPKPPLDEHLRLRRLQFCIYARRNPDLIQKFCDTDESMIVMDQVKGSYIWVSKNDDTARYPDVRVQHPRKWMVWGGISYSYGPTNLHILEENEIEDALVYRRILQKTYLPYQSIIRSDGGDPILRQDGASVHQTMATLAWMCQHDIALFDGFPARSPDLTMGIEMCWAIMKKMLQKAPLHLSSEMFKKWIRFCWFRATSPSFLAYYKEIFEHNCLACLRAAGGNEFCDYIRKCHGRV